MSKKFNSDFNNLIVNVKYQILGNGAYLDRYGDEMMVASNTNFNENPSFFSGMHNYFEWAKLSDDEVLAIFDYYTWDSEGEKWTKLTEIPENADDYEEEEDVPTEHTEDHDHVKVLNIELVEDEFCPKFKEDTQEKENRYAHIDGIKGMEIGSVCKVDEEETITTVTSEYYQYNGETWKSIGDSYEGDIFHEYSDDDNWQEEVSQLDPAPEDGSVVKINTTTETTEMVEVYYKYSNPGQANNVSTCSLLPVVNTYYDIVIGRTDNEWGPAHLEPTPDVEYTEVDELPDPDTYSEENTGVMVRGTGSEKIKVQFDISEDLLLQFHPTRYFQPMVTIDGKEYTLKVLTGKEVYFNDEIDPAKWVIDDEGEEPEPLTFYLNRDHRVTITWAPGKVVEEFLFIANRL